MAASKNNRKKGSKRAPQRTAPPGFESGKPKPLTKQQQAEAEENAVNEKMNVIRTVGMVVLVIGFSIAYWAGAVIGEMYVIGYPISIGGAMMCFYSARQSIPRRLMPQICYLAFIAIIIVSWFASSQT